MASKQPAASAALKATFRRCSRTAIASLRRTSTAKSSTIGALETKAIATSCGSTSTRPRWNRRIRSKRRCARSLHN